MANQNEHVNELNILEKNGNLEDINHSKELKEQVDGVHKGDVHINQVEQFIGIDKILDAAKSNPIFINMQEPCALEGISIINKLEFILKNETITPETLDDRIKKAMGNILESINKESNSLFFDNTGIIDTDRSIEKANALSRPVARFIYDMYRDEGKNIVIGTNDTLIGALLGGLSDQPDEYFKMANETIFKMFEELHSKPIFFNDSPWILTDSNHRINTEESKEANITVNIIGEIQKRLEAVVVRGKNDAEDKEILIEIFTVYQELERISGLSRESLGFSETEFEQIQKYVNELKLIAEKKFAFCSLNRVILNGLTVEMFGEEFDEPNIIARINEKTSEILDPIREGVSREFENYQDLVRQRGEITLADEMKRINQVRMIKILKHLINETDEANRDDINSIAFYVKLQEEHPELYQLAEDSYESSDTLDIYTYAITRELMHENLREFKNVRVKDEKKASISEYTLEFGQLSTLVRALKIDTPYRSSEDEQMRQEALDIIFEMFPNLAANKEKLNLDNKKEYSDFTNRLYQEIKIRYRGKVPDIAFETKLTGAEAFLKYADLRFQAYAKTQLYRSLVDNGKGEELEKLEYDKVASIFEKQEVKDLVSKEKRRENQEVFENKRYTKITKSIAEKAKLREKGELSELEQFEYILLLATAAKIYINGEQTDNPSLKGQVNELKYTIKSELVEFLPEVFTLDGTLEFDKLDEIIRRNYIDEIKLEELTANDEKSVLTGMQQQYEQEIHQEMEETDRNIKAKKISMEETRNAIAELKISKEVERNERILKFLSYVSSSRKTRRNERANSRNIIDDDLLEQQSSTEIVSGMISELVKDKIRDLYDNKEQAEKSFEDIENVEFDETVYQAFLREGKRKVANKMIKELEDTYKDDSVEMTEWDARGILSIYLATKYDNQEETINTQKIVSLQGRINKLLAKVSPELIDENKEVNESVLLEIYNNLNNRKFEDIEDAIIYQEDVIIGEYVNAMYDESISPNSQKKSEYTDVLFDEATYVAAKVQESYKRRVRINETIDIMDRMQAMIRNRFDSSLSVEDECTFIKDIYLMVSTLDEGSLDKKGLSDEGAKFQEIERKMLGVAKENIELYFSNVIDRNGNIDRKALDRRVTAYLRENDPEFIKKVDGGMSLLDAVIEDGKEKKSNFVGPMPAESFKVKRENLIKRFETGFSEYSKIKEESTYLSMISALKKMSEKSENRKHLSLMLKHLDSKCPGIIDKMNNEGMDGIDVDDSYVDSVAVIGGKLALGKEYKKYFEVGKKQVPVSEIPFGEKRKIIQLALGTIQACDNLPNYKYVSSSNTRKLAVTLLNKILPGAIGKDNKIDVDNLVDLYNEQILKNNRSKITKSGEEFLNDSLAKLYTKVSADFYFDKEIDGEYYNLFTNERLRTSIRKQAIEKAKNDERPITDVEMEQAQGKLEDILIGENNPEVSKKASDGPEVEYIDGLSMDDVMERIGEDLNVGDDSKNIQDNQNANENPDKVQQEESSLNANPDILLENINFNEEEQKSLAEVSKFRQFLNNIKEKARETVRNVVNLFNRKTEKDTGEVSSTDSNDGVNKTVQNTKLVEQRTLNYDYLNNRNSNQPVNESERGTGGQSKDDDEERG